MNRLLSRLIVWGCRAFLLLVPVLAVYFLSEPAQLKGHVLSNIEFSIQWHTVTNTQWYGLWALTLIYLLPGLIGIFFLQRAFSSFAQGETFELSTTQDLRRFATLLFIQAIARPVYLAAMSVLLSFNHPAGERALSLIIGSEEFQGLALAMIFWVICDLLVKANHLEHENKQFV